jgi:SET domain/MYND finger
MNQWQRAVNSNTESQNQHVKNARRRLTPAHIAVGAIQTPLSLEEARAIAVGAIQTPTCVEGFRNAEVVSIPIQGRHVIASKVVEQGISVFSEQPFVHEIDEKWIGKRCSFCLGANTTIPCRQCSFHRYCSASCESNNWTSGLHSIFCNLHGIFDSDMVLVLKAFTKSSFDQQTTPFCFSQRGRDIPSLVSNIDSMPENDIKSYTIRAQLCVDLFYWPKESVQLLVNIMAQIRCNRFAIKATVSTNTAGGMVEHQETAVGSAVYAQASMFNHSCAPNAFVTFDGPQITVRCSETVLKGEEINISYGPVATRHSTIDRQKELTEKYRFQCNCRACLQR